MKNEKHILIDIPEADIDFTNPIWKSVVKKDFQDIQNALEKNPNLTSPKYHTWFWFFMRYGRALCSLEGQAYLKENNLSVFNFVKDVVGLTMTSGGAYTIGYSFFCECLNNALDIDINGLKIHTKDFTTLCYKNSDIQQNNSAFSFLHALRTKPFLLLAGISGTGKSRKVRELAFKSCPEYLRDADGTTPGNYCMIEVKPNWHDSSEILGYYSSIASEYRFTKFVKFLVKATLHPDVPFFVCLDEMNLAPVEQYFAEILSVLETRKRVDKHIKTGIIVDGKYFKSAGKTKQCTDNREVYMKLQETTSEHVNEEVANSHSLIEKGLTLPDNVFIVGTVNMDDTTHQFSRKVIDRAMTIEMNGEDLSKMFETFDDLKYLDEKDVWPLEKFAPKYVTADEALDEHQAEANDIKQKLIGRLKAINDILNGTPFVVSYRVLNELCIYTVVLLEDGMSLDYAINTAVDQITLMKILPRIEGDEDMFAVKDNDNNRLVQLKNLFAAESDSYKKLNEMNERLVNCGFTRFWP